MSNLKHPARPSEADVLKLIPADWRQQTILFSRLLVGPGWVGRVGCLFRRHELDGRQRWRTHRLNGTYRGPVPPGTGAYAVSYALTGRAELLPPSAPGRPLSPGTLFTIIRPDAAKRPRVAACGSFLECSLAFDFRTGRTLERMGLWPAGLDVADVGLKAGLVSGYVRMAECIANAAVASGAVFRLTIAFLEQLSQSLATHSPTTGFAARACRLLRENPQPGFTMQDAADAMGVQYHVFRRLFRRDVGMAPNQYQLRERLNLARELLATHSVKETASLLGYTDPYFFSNQFQRTLGVRPKQFRA